MFDIVPFPLAVAGPHHLWYALPLILVVSLVYAATRHELFAPMIRHAVRSALWISGFMAAIFVLIHLIS